LDHASNPNLDVDLLLDRHQAALRRFVQIHAATLVRRRESLSDLVQTVFRELVEALPGLRFDDETKFRNWLYATARNKLRDRLKYYLRDRRDARREELREVLSDAYRDLFSPSEVAISNEEIDRIERCLQQLSDEHREIILLSKISRLSAAEIGGIIGRGEGATRALLSRALARLGTLLGK
jgi:RNA polymerase sigma-70 factor (ECF subfamily)